MYYIYTSDCGWVEAEEEEEEGEGVVQTQGLS
jgi:hypothetical protein